MKRIAIVVAMVMVAALCLAAFTSCYVSKPAALKNVVGTYRLTTYTHTYSVEQEGADEKTQEVHNLLEERSIEAYLVVRDDGTGYYVYREGDETTARSVKITYQYDDEKPSLVKEISYTTGTTESGDSHPGKGRETLGVYFKGKTKTLSFTLPSISLGLLQRKYSQTVKYSCVDGATDLSYVEKQLGTTLRVANYAVAELDGVFLYDGSYDAASDYIYYYIDMRPAEATADVYYARKADGNDQVLRNQAVRFDIPTIETGVYDPKYITITVGDSTFYSAYSGAPIIAFLHRNQEGVDDVWFGKSVRRYTNIPESIAAAKAAYASTQEQTQDE